ncbi:unnamed protein product [Closterium sp. NIES-65]|nr:unnamed protein product [Closterium sp. NIES-65]
MGSMRASPAGLLLLAVALIAAVQMTKAANGDDTVKRMTHRSMLRSTLKGANGEGMVAETTSRKVNARIAQEITASDPACAALGCEPVGGKCEVDKNGERYCKWASPCGSCPVGATCKTYLKPSTNELLPYCSCPSGYGMTATSCVQGGAPTVSSFSYTVVVNETAKDAASRPWTFRLNPNGCTEIPAAVAVARTVTSYYSLQNIGDAPACRKVAYYKADKCEGEIDITSSSRDQVPFLGEYVPNPL